MDEITKNTLHRWLQKLGLRLLNPKSYRYEHDPANYAEMRSCARPVILDVGANIGQTAIDFALAFPNAEIHAFEPFEAVYRTLKKHLQGWPGITAHHVAMGERPGELTAKRVTSNFVQTTTIKAAATGETDLERIKVTTVDEFCAGRGIGRVGLLKVDAEGWDLKVLVGATGMFQKGAIDAVLTEASIRQGDTQHAAYSEIATFVRQFGFGLYSIYGLRHGAQGELDYFNALFKPGIGHVEF